MARTQSISPLQTSTQLTSFVLPNSIDPLIQFESSVLEKRVNNPRRYFLRIVCNQIVVTNGTIRRVLSMPTYYYTFSEFIDAVGSEMVNVLSLISITIEEEYVKFNVQGELWYLDRDSNDTTIDRWFLLDSMVQTVSIGTQPGNRESCVLFCL